MKTIKLFMRLFVAMNSSLRFVLLVALTITLLGMVLAQSKDWFGVCIRNCAQCKRMFGPWFAGERCANACIKFKGKLTPDCVDADSIAPFLKKADEDD
ncbi:eclosion hormone isoform X2 [Vespula squamosa]|uniref:Eclosion hormone isoform X2 n=1 Tax=Vespula squamosa TaxID=30214 RepID=A0ABD1ZTM9_VESSQ